MEARHDIVKSGEKMGYRGWSMPCRSIRWGSRRYGMPITGTSILIVMTPHYAPDATPSIRLSYLEIACVHRRSQSCPTKVISSVEPLEDDWILTPPFLQAIPIPSLLIETRSQSSQWCFTKLSSLPPLNSIRLHHRSSCA